MAALDGENLKELAAQKEKEWKEIQELRSQSLELALRETEKLLNEEKARFQKLKEDFKYNLKLLGERDAELDKYDSSFSELKTKLAEKDGEISDLKIKIDEFKTSLSREIKSREDMQQHYQHRIREKQADLEQYKSAKDCEVGKERQEIEGFKRNIERQLRETEDELDIQKRELTTEFEEMLRKREHEFRKQADEMSSVVLAHELKVKLLQKEIEMMKASHERTSGEVKEVEGQQRSLEKQLKQKDWDLQDTKAMKDARISELDAQLHHAEDALVRAKEDFQRKHEQLDKLVREKEATLQRTKDAHNEKIKELDTSVHSLEKQLEDAAVELRQLQWSKDDTVKEKDMFIERLQEELNEVKHKWETHTSEILHEEVRRDLEVQATKQNEEKLKTEILQRKSDIERYKRELTSTHERLSALERAKVQLDLDWQKRYDDLERQQYERSEDLVKRLTQTRDEALASLREKERELQQRNDLVAMLTTDRDQALATLKQHGLGVSHDIDISVLDNVPSSAAEHFQEMQAQNENLREVIRQMRQQMEALGSDMNKDSGTKQDSVTEGYVRNLEKELSEWKEKFRKLEDGNHIKEAPTEDIPSGVQDNILVTNHVKSLNNTIGSMRSDKVELTAQVRKQQARIQYLTTQVDQLHKQPQQQQVEIAQLKYELGAQQRRYQTEVASLRQRVGDLELQVSEARHEADEYHKSSIEKNMEITALNNQLSALQMDTAQHQPTINFGAQELLIQQLQDEIERLRRQQKGDSFISDDIAASQPIKGHPAGSTAAIAQLQNKLRLAAKHIRQLAKEKQQLIEVNNKLRGQLNQNGIKPPPPSAPVYASQVPPRKENVPTDLSLKVQNKLSQLEQLQYELTKRELAVNKPVQPARPVEVVSETPSDTGEEENLPPPILKKTPRSTSPRVADMRSAMDRPRTGDSERPRTAQSDYSQVLTSMSLGGESLQDIWKMLDDEGVSPRPFTPQNFTSSDQIPERLRPMESDDQPPSTGSFTVKGQKPAIGEKRNRPTQRPLSEKAWGRVNKQKPKKSQTRNYNVKDDPKS